MSIINLSWKSKKEEFKLYCRDINLYLQYQNVNEDLREKWNKLTESQVWYFSWDPSTACFARGDPSTACFACGPRYLVVDSISFGILVRLALLVVPSTACFACGPLKFFNSESTYDIVRKISEKMKSIDLIKPSFNNLLLLFILDLDRIDPIISDLISKSLLKESKLIMSEMFNNSLKSSRELNHRIKSISASTFSLTEIDLLKNDGNAEFHAYKIYSKKWLNESLLPGQSLKISTNENLNRKETFTINSPALNCKSSNITNNSSNDSLNRNSSIASNDKKIFKINWNNNNSNEKMIANILILPRPNASSLTSNTPKQISKNLLNSGQDRESKSENEIDNSSPLNNTSTQFSASKQAN
ncbi:572_t:CDS:2 [Cetraspora pellucida]|uniref:572_t:CDS:1 n=1 Tax=Cetraspora pellucida TaxID=1433469 RepID=A0ACA9M3F8_9GLOM|nr:572_t:CDS:2 [Cetraspora pellucida]